MVKKNQNGDQEVQTIEADTILEELQAIKKLLIVLLVKLGSDSAELGEATKISSSTLRNWISFSEIKPTIMQTSAKHEGKPRKRKPKGEGAQVSQKDTEAMAPVPEVTPLSEN